MMKINYYFIILTLFLSQVCAAQFTVTAVATDEECPGTGALTLSVQNADPSAPVNYKVYLLPETNVPFWNSSNGNLVALQDGEYHIVASQVVNGSTVTAETNAVIGSNYVPLSFTISSVNAVCGNDGSMVINVNSGSPSTYEILDGPATAGPQTSNVFNGLPAGSYEVRVTDNCGNGFVSTQSFYVEQPSLTLSGPEFPTAELIQCDKIEISFSAASQNPEIPVVYPLNVQYTVHPPAGGTPIIYNQTVTEGEAASAQLTQLIQYYDSAYTVDIKVTDICGTSYELNNNVISQQMTAQGGVAIVQCGFNTLDISLTNHKAPFTVNFTATPAGFNPSEFNTSYPGPFSGSSVIFGNQNNPVPLGSYSFTVTDACGRTSSGQVEVTVPVVPVPEATATNHDCINELGNVAIAIPNYPLQTATIVAAPSGYSETIPYDASAFIDEGALDVGGLPQGDYTFTLTDICGNTYENVTALVPGYSPQDPQFDTRPDCVEGMGTIRFTANIAAVSITSAPDGFGQPLPYDVSFNIINGTFAMEGLPGGNYTFAVNTVCESGFSIPVEIPAFTVITNEVDTTSDCNNFDIELNYITTAENLTTFWLQQYSDDLDMWVHPDTGVAYIEGEDLNSQNALQIHNQSPNNDFSYIGELRIMKMQRAFTNGTSGRSSKACIEEFHEFSFYNELDITGIYNLTCVGEVVDIQVNVQGVSPLHFELISKNGDTSFYVDNHEDPVFIGLEPAIYQVRVTDPCGGYRVEQFNVSELPPLVSATQPEDLVICDVNETGSGTFDLSVQNDPIIGELDPDIVTITYHLSSADASQDVNPLPTTYTSGSAEIFARVEWNVNPECYGLASFNLVVAPPTPLAMEDLWAFCEGQSVTVVADPGYVSYSWSTGETTQSIEVSEPGTYTVTVVSATTCEMSKTIEVVPATPPVIRHVDVDDFRDDQNTVTVVMENPELMPLYEFSLDGINFQASNVFTDVPAGEYTVLVKDRFGCNEFDQKDIYILTYPKFFTPNGDGVHDTWRIEYAILEPDMMVYIYDRYGKPIAEFGATSEGWDGTFQGYTLPSTDYWFVVKRQDGREMRGHFAMMR